NINLSLSKSCKTIAELAGLLCTKHGADTEAYAFGQNTPLLRQTIIKRASAAEIESVRRACDAPFNARITYIDIDDHTALRNEISPPENENSPSCVATLSAPCASTPSKTPARLP